MHTAPERDILSNKFCTEGLIVTLSIKGGGGVIMDEPEASSIVEFNSFNAASILPREKYSA